jgi:hypothetical protein
MTDRGAPGAPAASALDRGDEPPVDLGSTRSLLRVILTVVTVLLAIGAVDVWLVQRGFDRATAEATAARAHLRDGDVAAALDAGERATDAIERAARRTERWHWRAAEHLPLVGASAGTVRATADVGQAAGAVATEVIDTADGLLDDTRRTTLLSDGRIDLVQLEALRQRLHDLPLAALEDTRVHLAATGADGWTPGVVDRARDDAVGVADELLAAAERGQGALDVVTSMLGSDGPRRYLVAVQNPAELRGTGGLIGFLAVLDLTDGQLALAEPSGVDASSRIDGTVLLTTGRFSRTVEAGIDASEAFVARYGGIGGTFFLPSTNVDPDLPTVAPLILSQYELASGERLDGLLAIDPIGLQLVYEAIGPLDVPGEVAAYSDELPDPIPPHRIAEVLLVDSYEVLGGPSDERRRYQAELGEAAVTGLVAGGWDPLALARAAGTAVTSRHLQVASAHPDEQATLERLGAAGELRTAHADEDLLAVTAVNIAGNKADAHVAHRIRHEVALRPPQLDGDAATIDRTVTTRVEVDNGVDLASDRYISTALLPRRTNEEREFDPRPGLVRTWWSVWLPADARLEHVHDLDGEPTAVRTDELHGLRIVDHFLDTLNATTNGFEVAATATAPVVRDEGEVIYTVLVRRQPKAVADQLEVVVRAPEGWQVTDGRLTGPTGPEVGLGPAPFDRPVRIAVDDDEVTARGSATADVRIEVTLARR